MPSISFILIYKRVFLVLYLANLVVAIWLYFFGSENSRNSPEASLIFTIFILGVNFWTYKLLKGRNFSSDLFLVEKLFSIGRMIMNILAFTRVGLMSTFSSPVVFVVWVPLMETTLGESNSIGISFHIVVLLLFCLELIYFLEIRDLKRMCFPESEYD